VELAGLAMQGRRLGYVERRAGLCRAGGLGYVEQELFGEGRLFLSVR